MYQSPIEAHETRDGPGEEQAGGTLVELIRPVEEPPHRAEDGPEATDFVEFYGFTENPFSDAVNPAYFYKTDIHEESYIRMMLAVRHNISLGLVSGPSGSGKTLMSQMVLQNLDPALYRPALVLVSPGMGKTALLREILEELDVELPSGPFVRTQELLNRLQDQVMALHEAGKKLIVIIDECHFLGSDTLHMLRTLSNIEVPEKKLLTCLLFAEERFVKRLEHPTYESLRNRMYLRGELPALQAAETEQYVKYRLLVAGRSDAVFADDVFALVHEKTGGICRRINKLCMLCLLEGYLHRKPFLDREIVETCARQL